MDDKKTFKNMTVDEMLEHAKEALNHVKERSEEEEIEEDAEDGYFDDD